MIGVRQTPLGEIPGLLPSEAGIVEQDAHQFGYCHCGCVSFSWIAILSGSCPQSVLLRRNRRTRSVKEQATRKYSCMKRSACPILVESSGYSTRVNDSAASRPAKAATKSPLLNSWKSK